MPRLLILKCFVKEKANKSCKNHCVKVNKRYVESFRQTCVYVEETSNKTAAVSGCPINAVRGTIASLICVVLGDGPEPQRGKSIPELTRCGVLFLKTPATTHTSRQAKYPAAAVPKLGLMRPV
jgi:hypothetical protein